MFKDQISPDHPTSNTNKSGDFTSNKNMKMSSFKSSKNIQKKEGWPDISVSDNQSSSVTLNKLAFLPFPFFSF